MKVICARHAGACYGVNRAIQIVDDAIGSAHENEAVYTLGPLIHNPVVVDDLRNRGVYPIDSPGEVDSGTLILRTHGVTPNIIEEAQNQGLSIIDATCPYVSKVHKAAAALSEQGYFVIILGEAGHPEVEGIKARAGEQVLVVESAEDLPHPLPSQHIGVVVQTTQTEERLQELLAVIQEANPSVDLQVRDTICNATHSRQESARALASKSDVMIVLGGKFSGNTTRLAQICKEICPRTYHIETLDELDYSWFTSEDMVGVTAGASTPTQQVQELLDFLNNMEVD